MNIPLLRKVQASIADEQNAFHMLSWGECIAGHAVRIVLADEGKPLMFERMSEVPAMAQKLLDLTDAETAIFYLPASTRRQAAIDAIEEYIRSYQATHALIEAGETVPFGDLERVEELVEV